MPPCKSKLQCPPCKALEAAAVSLPDFRPPLSAALLQPDPAVAGLQQQAGSDEGGGVRFSSSFPPNSNALQGRGICQSSFLCFAGGALQLACWPAAAAVPVQYSLRLVRYQHTVSVPLPLLPLVATSTAVPLPLAPLPLGAIRHYQQLPACR